MKQNKRKLLVTGLLLALGATSASGASPNLAGDIKKIDFTPGKELSLLVLNYTGQGSFRLFQSEQQGSVIIEAENLSLPAALTKAIDTSAKDSPVMQVTPYNSGDGRRRVAKIVVQLRQKAEAKLSEIPGRVVLEIRRKSLLGPGAAADARAREMDEVKSRASANEKSDEVARRLIEVLNAPASDKNYFGSRVTFEASNADVHDIFRLVGESSGLNIMTDSGVSAKSNFSLKDVPWDQLLDLVIQQAALKAIITGNVVRIIPLEKYNKDQEAKLKQIALGDELEPVIMAVIPLSFAKAEEMSKMIDALLVKKDNTSTNDPNKLAAQQAAIDAARTAVASAKPGDSVSLSGIAPSKVVQDFVRGHIEVDTRSNSLVVTNTKDAIERIRRLVKELDVPLPQVLIDAKVIVAKDDFAKKVGISWSGKLTSSGTGRAGAGAGFNGGATTLGAGDTAAGSPAFDITGGKDPAGLAFGFQLGAGRHGNLGASLALAESNSLSKTIASPRIIVNNKVAATISDGSTLYLPTSAGANGSGSLVPVTANLNMSVTPQVTSSGSILLTVDLKKDAIAPNAGQASAKTDTKSIKTEVLVDNGSTLVLGGVYTFDASKSEAGIPMLKDLPFIGQLFRTNTDATNKSELMVFITPQIIAPSGYAQPITQ